MSEIDGYLEGRAVADAMSPEFARLIRELCLAVIPWEGPAVEVGGSHPDATYWQRRVGGDNPGLAQVYTFPGKFVWAWWPDRGEGESTTRNAEGSAEDGWAQVELAIRRQMVRR